MLYAGVQSLGKKAAAKLTAAGPNREKLPVVTDPDRLVNYVCGSNFYTTGEDIKLKPDSEYPDWIWTLYNGKYINIFNWSIFLQYEFWYYSFHNYPFIAFRETY